MSYELQSVPFYFGFLNQPIPEPNDCQKTGYLHVLLMGLIINYSAYGKEKYCFASSEYLAERLGITVNKLYKLRGDLLRLGWIECEYGDRNKVVRMWANFGIYVINEAKKHSAKGPNSEIEQLDVRATEQLELGGYAVNRTTVTSVSTPVGNNNLLNNSICPRLDRLGRMCPGNNNNSFEMSTPTKKTVRPCSPSLISSVDSPQMDRGRVVKNTTPFGEAVEVRANSGEVVKARKMAFAVANELVAVASPNEKVTPNLAKVIRSLLDKGYSKEELMSVARLSREDTYYHDKSAMVIFSEKGVADLLAKQKKMVVSRPTFYSRRPDGTYCKVVDGEEIDITEEEWLEYQRKRR